MALYKALRRKRDKTTSLGGWIITVIGLLATILVTNEIIEKNRKEDKIRIDYEIANILRRTQGRMDRYVATLLQVRAFIMNTERINPEVLNQYISDSEIQDRLPGIQGIGVTLFTNKNRKGEFEKEWRKFYPEFKIWPDTPERELYSAIVFLSPNDWRNRKALGYDMWSEPIRREAMEMARDKNEAALTHKVVLVQEKLGEALPGLNLYVPLFRKNTALMSDADKKKAILGYVYAPFRAQILFKAIFSEYDMIMDVEIYDGETLSPVNLIYDHDPQVPKTNASISKTIDIYGRKLTFLFTRMPKFRPANDGLKALWVLVFGFISTLLIGSVWFLTRRQMRIASIMAAENERMLKKEKEHVAARDEFLSIASHELKTPLTSLKLQAQVMLRAINRQDPNVYSPERIMGLIKQIDTQTTRLTRLVDDMLDLSRIRTGKLRIEKRPVELAEMVIDVVERLRPQFVERIGEIPRVKIEKNSVGDWDKFRIEQVLTNLLTNALKYGNDRPVDVIIAGDDKMAKVIVRDYGIGIAKENVSKIFERFERAGISASEVSGLGLGLFITRQIIRSHGGTIDVESEIGKGSTFTVSLPLEKHEYYRDQVL